MQFRNCPFQILIAKYPRESINNSEYITNSAAYPNIIYCKFDYILERSTDTFIINIFGHAVNKIERYKCMSRYKRVDHKATRALFFTRVTRGREG